MLADMEKVFAKKKSLGSGFADGAKNVFTGANNGTFSNILGGFGGGGRFGGTVASALDGAAAGGGGIGATLGGLAAGAGIGLAISAISGLISLLKSGATAVYEFTKSAVNMAASFEETVNSIAVFAGGVSNAKVELKALEKVVENTTGLSLEGAEAGYRQLRALGFEAENSRKLIEGLGKIKITSGATEQSVERVIVNLTQLPSSTARAGQDIKEIIHALPAMRQVFREAFGTSEATKLKALIEKDGDAFFAKLASGMEKFKGASGGMNDALTKLDNQWIITSREIGKPIVPVATEAFKDLTSFLKENKDVFRDWGYGVAATLKYVVDISKSFTHGFKENYPFLYKLATFTPFNAIGQNAAPKLDPKLQSLPEDQKDFFLGLNKDNSFESQLGGFLQEKNEAEYILEDARLDKLADLKEKARVKDLESLENSYSLQKAITDGYYQVLEARANANLTYTSTQELAKTKEIAEIRKEGIKSQINDATSYYDSAIALQVGNDSEIIKLRSKKNEELTKLGTQLQVLEINSAREIAEAERKITEQRRQSAIEFTQIQIEEAKFGYDRISQEVERGLSRQTISTTEGYKRITSATIQYFNETKSLTDKRFELQLRDLTLSDEAKANLIEKHNLEELQLESQKSDALLKIQDDKFASEESKRSKNLERLKAYYSSVGQLVSGVAATFFKSENFASSSVNSFRDLVLGGGAKERNRLIAEADQAQKDYDKTRNLPDVDGIALNGALINLTKTKTAADDAKAAFEGYSNALPLAYGEIDRLGESLTKVVGDFKAFDEISRKALETQHELERASVEAELSNIRERLQNTRSEYLEQLRSEKINRLSENAGFEEKRRQNPDNIGTIEQSVIDGNLLRIKQIEEALANASENKDFLPPTDKVIELNGQLKQTGLGLQNLKLRQYSEEAELYANSLEGLAERLQLLQSGDIGAVNGVLDQVSKDVLKERISLATENIELEARIGLIGEDSASRYRNAWLKAIYDVKSASEDARESQIQSQVEIANQTVFNADVAKAGILEAMAGAKGYTEIFQDAFLSVNSSITDGISSLLKKATDGLGAFGDVLANIASQLLTMVTNRLMMKLLDMLLPTSSGVGGASSGGFSIGNILTGILGGAGGRGTNSLGINLGSGGANGGNNSISSALLSSVLPSFARGGALASNGGFGVADAFSSVSSITNSDTLTNTLSGGGGYAPYLAMKAGFEADKKAAISGVGGLFGGGNFSLGNLGKSLGGMAPLLGLSLGAGLGGNSTAGQLLGGIGGLAGGLALGIGTGAIGTGATAGFSILGGVLSAGAATGILAAVAVPLLVGGYLFGRNKQRRQDEVTRTEYLTDAFGKLDDILAKVKSHDISGSEAITAAESVRESYREAASTLKSKKTRNIALKEIQDRINPKIDAIRAAAKIADEDKARFSDLELPEFATGGIVPGRFGEPRLVLAHGGEIIANPSQQTPAFIQAASDAGIPGIKGSAGSNNGNGNSGNLYVEVSLGTDAQNQIFVNGAKSRAGYNVLIEQTDKKDTFRDTKF